ncbi:MAG: HlyD family efflux transporter periplasmic adaptor subunit [Myxococcales bacterium]|nr:HlyD family efflux transporter periplasmic adaptor subunit [Myxococcales bacterium]
MRRFLLLFGVLLASPACGRPSISVSKPAAQVDPGRITLTPEAEARLGIVAGLASVAQVTGPTRRLYPGEVMPAPGDAAMLTAPLAGTVTAVAATGLPAAGSPVQAGQPILVLSPLPMLSERAQVATILSEIDAQVARARSQEQTAVLALARAQSLVADGLAGKKLLEEASANSDSARATRQAVEAQRAALTNKAAVGGSSMRVGLLAPTRIPAPFDGFVRDVRVTLHQHVAIGTPLCEVVRRAALWVRVAVPSSQIASVAPEADALISDLSASPSAAPLRVPPVPHAPQTSQPGTGALDLYFQLPDAAPFRIGQRVAAWVVNANAAASPRSDDSRALRSVGDLLAIPAAALLYSPSGETWVYQRTTPQTFVHRRVDVLRSDGDRILLRGSSTLPAGALLVTAGAAELAGVEYGVAK